MDEILNMGAQSEYSETTSKFVPENDSNPNNKYQRFGTKARSTIVNSQPSESHIIDIGDVNDVNKVKSVTKAGVG